MPVTHSHSFLIDDFSTGLSPIINEIQIDVRKLTLTLLRPILMYNSKTHMNKRSLLFQEVLFIMSRLPNLYDRPKDDLTKWQYGYVKKNETKVKLIHPDREDQLIVSIIPELYKHDLVIVPLSQIPPTLQIEPTIENHQKEQQVQQTQNGEDQKDNNENNYNNEDDNDDDISDG